MKLVTLEKILLFLQILFLNYEIIQQNRNTIAPQFIASSWGKLGKRNHSFKFFHNNQKQVVQTLL